MRQTAVMTHCTSLPPIADGLFACDPESGRTRLLAGRHRESGRLVFPCPSDEAHEAEALPATGRLWSYTLQRFRPKSPPYAGPETFEPYAVGYVDFGGLIVEGRIEAADPAGLKIGQAMAVTTLALDLTGPERRVATYAFRPAGESDV